MRSPISAVLTASIAFCVGCRQDGPVKRAATRRDRADYRGNGAAEDPPVAEPVATTSEEEEQGAALLVSPSPFRLLASNVSYGGVRLRKAPGEFYGEKLLLSGVEYYRAVMKDGLVARDTGTGEATLFPMFELAVSAGWYEKPKNTYHPNAIRGLFRQGRVLWMGSNGVGVLALDTATSTLRRYDVKTTPVIGHHMDVSYADDQYVFASYGYHKDVPVARPSLHILSVDEGTWLWLKAVPSKYALSLGNSEGLLVPIPFDYRHYARKEYVPLGDVPGLGFTGLAGPHEIVRQEDGSYLLRYPHSEKSKTELLLRTDLLARAFGDGCNGTPRR